VNVLRRFMNENPDTVTFRRVSGRSSMLGDVSMGGNGGNGLLLSCGMAM
jgi:hypothetical protein